VPGESPRKGGDRRLVLSEQPGSGHNFQKNKEQRNLEVLVPPNFKRRLPTGQGKGGRVREK